MFIDTFVEVNYGVKWHLRVAPYDLMSNVPVVTILDPSGSEQFSGSVEDALKKFCTVLCDNIRLTGELTALLEQQRQEQQAKVNPSSGPSVSSPEKGKEAPRVSSQQKKG